MRRIGLTFLILCLCVNLLAQKVKPCLFIGIYEKTKNGICSDYDFVHEEIMDYTDFSTKRKTFYETHKTNAITLFVDINEAIIVYQYEKEISGWKCNSKVVGYKTGKSIEDCRRQLSEQLEKKTSDFTTTPITVFTWLGKKDSKSEYTRDFGGLNGKFTSVNVGSKSIIVAQLKNTTTDQLACVEIKTDGKESYIEYIEPGSTFTKKYNTKNMQINIIYQDGNKQRPAYNLLNFLKSKIQETIINEDGKIKSRAIGSSGVRG